MELIGYKVGITVAAPPTDFVNMVLKEIGGTGVFGTEVALINKINNQKVNNTWHISFCIKKAQDAEQFAHDLEEYCIEKNIEICNKTNVYPIWDKGKEEMQ